MPRLAIFANSVLGTAFGHLQFVFDPDASGAFDGDELDLDVDSGLDWDVAPVDAFNGSDSDPAVFFSDVEALSFSSAIAEGGISKATQAASRERGRRTGIFAASCL